MAHALGLMAGLGEGAFALLPLLGLGLLRPIFPSHRPGNSAPLWIAVCAAALVGAWAGSLTAEHRSVPCRLAALLEGEQGRTAAVTSAEFRVRGVLLAEPSQRGVVPIRMTAGVTGACRDRVLAVFPEALGSAPGSAPGRVRGWAGSEVWARATPLSPLDVSGRTLVLALEDVRAGSSARTPSDPDRGGRVGWIRRKLVAAKGSLQRRLRRELGPERGAVAEALVLAERGGLAPEVREAFVRAGVAHLLAISGFHVGVIAGALFLVAGWVGVPPGRRGALAALGTLVYVLFIGAPPAALRAALLMVLILAGHRLGRRVHGVGALATGFLVLLILDPARIQQAGFQLSFLGTLGLLVTGRPDRHRPESGAGAVRRALRALEPGVRAGLAATLFTAPIAIWHFGRISWVGIPATLLATPLVAAAVPGVLVLLLADLVAPPLSGLVALPLGWLLGGLVRVVEFLAAPDWAWAWLPPRLGLLTGVGWLALVALFPVAYRRAGRLRPGLLVATALAGAQLLPALDRLGARSTIELIMLDVGQGDGFLLRTPENRWVLVDAGPAGRDSDAGARVVVPYLKRRGVRRLEVAVLTHPDLDHIGGLASVLAGVDVGEVRGGSRAIGRGAFVEALAEARARGVPWVRAERGDTLRLDGVDIAVLHPGPPEAGGPRAGTGAGIRTGAGIQAGAGAPADPNDLSVVLWVRWEGFSALLLGDASVAVEERLLSSGLVPSGPLTVLKVGHHGSATSTSRALLEATRPSVALISAGRGNRFGHPHPGVLGRLRRYGVGVLRTDLQGGVAIEATRDGAITTRSVLH